MQDVEHSIRERAYHLWNDGGRKDGEADAHWLQAQREVLSESLGALGRVKADEVSPAAPKQKTSQKKRRAA
jgi:hypothetical protein